MFNVLNLTLPKVRYDRQRQRTGARVDFRFQAERHNDLPICRSKPEFVIFSGSFQYHARHRPEQFSRRFGIESFFTELDLTSSINYSFRMIIRNHVNSLKFIYYYF